MATMRQMVSERVERLSARHARAKEGPHGWIVRPLTLTLGWSVLIVGLITIPLPGQGWLTTFIGVGILSLEQEWARNLLRRGVNLYDRISAWFDRQPLPYRVTMITLLIILIWVVFLGIIYGTWKAGTLDFLTPYADQLGIVR